MSTCRGPRCHAPLAPGHDFCSGLCEAEYNAEDDDSWVDREIERARDRFED